ncbi:hypothetical protein HBDW_05070 [Herbaspirillum sp. DW155]|uniref:hypothetical protein n=1 Tax=Herbaspirillum sp. DW155 TaxID=3095609 RepID=UPI00308F98FE|nr:hypothetical protein HBDW_05070 [Herbaspirillum sp. DW155]
MPLAASHAPSLARLLRCADTAAPIRTEAAAVNDDLHVLPLHRRVRRAMQMSIAVAGIALVAAVLLHRALPLTAVVTSVLTGLLCGGCFAQLLWREQRGLSAPTGTSATLAVLLVCVVLAGMADAGVASGQRLELLPAVVSTLRHVLLPLLVFTYWLLFCGPVVLRWRVMLPFVPKMGWLAGMMIWPAQAGQVRFLLPTPGLPMWGEALVRTGLLVVMFGLALVVLRLMKKCLIQTGVKSRAFGDWNASAGFRPGTRL